MPDFIFLAYLVKPSMLFPRECLIKLVEVKFDGGSLGASIGSKDVLGNLQNRSLGEFPVGLSSMVKLVSV